ncbi:MAG: TetR/AcrR family transcriptional regulator [Myxococcota bacterium]
MARISKEAREKVRHRLLMSAADHFARQGFSGANINQISLDAGFAKGTVYNYFSSKADLFSAVLSVGSEQTVTRYQQRGVVGDTRAHLRALAEADVSLVRKHQSFMKVMVRELLSADPAVQATINAGMRPLRVVVMKHLDAGQGAGTIRTDMSAKQLAGLFLWQLTAAYLQHWRSDGRWPDWDAIPELVTSTFLDGAAR